MGPSIGAGEGDTNIIFANMSSCLLFFFCLLRLQSALLAATAANNRDDDMDMSNCAMRMRHISLWALGVAKAAAVRPEALIGYRLSGFFFPFFSSSCLLTALLASPNACAVQMPMTFGDWRSARSSSG